LSETRFAPAVEEGKRELPLAFILVVCWLFVIGWVEWSYALAETEPPPWDAFTYLQKAFYFWDAIGRGGLFNPLNLPPSIRPPGTVLMSYPLGFSEVFGAFYFRSIFIPLVLLVGAVYIVGYFRDMPAAAKWLLAALALAIGGMPILYQFQAIDDIAAAVFWGLVDNFLAAVAAIAIASARRSVVTLSYRWSIASASAAAFCLMIKPSGLLVMVLVAASWLLLISFRVSWRLVRLWREAELRRFCVISLIVAATIYGLAIIAAFTSEYLGATNLASGAAQLAVLQKDFARSIDIDNLLQSLHTSFGYPVATLIVLGLVASLAIRREAGAGVAGALCLAAGIWFWIFATDISQVRYFLPFGMMTFILVVPSILHVMQHLPTTLKVGSALTAVAATVAITILLFNPQMPVSWQRLFAVNLSAGMFRAEDEQALVLLKKLQKEGARSGSAFFLDLSSPARNFAAVLGYQPFIDSTSPTIQVLWPATWNTATAFRLNEIAAADYVVFVPLGDAALLRQILEVRSVPNFAAESLLMKAWFTNLTPVEGVELVSETRLRLLRISDRARFQETLEKLKSAYDWRAEFRDANQKP
jgi:hypothetical protein